MPRGRMASFVEGERAIVWVQNPLLLARLVSEFQPDVTLLKLRADFYRGTIAPLAFPRTALAVRDMIG
jgi:hypothetical protein